MEFNDLTYRGILILADDPCPECYLSRMSQNELEVLDERIDQIVNQGPNNQELFAKLMRLRSFLMLAQR